jgi:hypothetical protein
MSSVGYGSCSTVRCGYQVLLRPEQLPAGQAEWRKLATIRGPEFLPVSFQR